MITWKQNIAQFNTLLENLSVKDASHKEIGGEKGFSLWIEWTLGIRSKNQYIYFIGNGASASMASHFATDMAKNCRIRTGIFTDLSLVTALANDICYERTFSEPLSWWIKEGDMLIAISSSGNSPNIVKGIETAKALGGIVLTLSAMDDSNVIRGLGNLSFYIPAQTYGLAETSHATILHFWLDSIEKIIRQNPSSKH